MLSMTASIFKISLTILDLLDIFQVQNLQRGLEKWKKIEK